MAYLLSYTDPSTGAVYPTAYAMIRSVTMSKPNKSLFVTLGFFATQTARTGNLKPFQEQVFLFSDNASASGAMFTSNFGEVPLPASAPLTNPVNVDDMLLSQIYIVLRQHPSAAAILANATNT
jgi:hypothetical protein